MNNFKIHTEQSATEKSQELLTQVAENIGFAPNIFAVTAESPEALAGLIAINAAFSASSFTAQEQQIILMATSINNGCVYCVAGHSLMAEALEMPSSLINAMRNQQPIEQPRFAILRQIISELIQFRGRISDATMSDFFEQGFSKAQFFELVLGVAVKTFTNYVSNAITLQLDDAFKPYRWERPQNIKKSA